LNSQESHQRQREQHRRQLAGAVELQPNPQQVSTEEQRDPRGDRTAERRPRPAIQRDRPDGEHEQGAGAGDEERGDRGVHGVDRMRLETPTAVSSMTSSSRSGRPAG
jgi:hypothetical protein